MRYLVFGDVHANLLALDAVLEAGKARGVEAYFSSAISSGTARIRWGAWSG